MKKIMFNDKYGLTQAVLEGRKTMTRRIVPDNIYKKGIEYCNEYYADTLDALDEEEFLLEVAPFKPGDVVAVAQNLRDMGYDPKNTKLRSGAIWGLDHTPAWTNKMFVSASECVHQISITNVRVERLQDISDKDCVKEGIYVSETEPFVPNGYSPHCANDPKEPKEWFHTPREAFASLIDKVSGKGTWQANPYCFCYTFELVK